MAALDYYNEHDQFAAAWLRELIAAGEIPSGHVDERDIQDVQPSDLVGYRHCHFFAGIGGWALAMRLAEWPDDRPIWTGSAPCQPFSAAGQGAGFADERHLWPAFFWLIQQCQPRALIGEQVASGDALRWWDLVATDLEGAGYACAAVDLPAASVGAPHKRSRLFWVADAEHAGYHRPRGDASESCGDKSHEWVSDGDRAAGVVVADASGERCDGQPIQLLERRPRQAGPETAGGGAVGGKLADAALDGRGASVQHDEARESDAARHITDGGMGDTTSRGQRVLRDACHEGSRGHAHGADESDGSLVGDPSGQGPTEQRRRRDESSRLAASSLANPWADCVWLPCADGKARPVESAPLGLADGLLDDLGRVRLASHPDRPHEERLIYAPLIQKGKARVGRLRGYGNGIVPQVAAEVLMAWQAVMS